MTSQTDSTPDSTPSDRKEWISSKLYFASLYFITVGVLYLWGYWPRFNINILEYLDLADIIKVTAYPVAISVVLIAVSSVGGSQLGRWQSLKLDVRLDNARAHAIRTGSNAELHRLKKYGSRLVNALTGIYIGIALFSIFLWAIDSMFAWVILPTVLALPITRQLDKSGFLEDRVDNELLRFLLMFAFAAIPLFSYGQGKIASQNIVEGRAYNFVASDFPGNSAKKTEDRIRYIGHAGEHVFFYDPLEKGTVIAKIEDDKPLTIKRFSERLSLYALKSIKSWSTSLTNFFTDY